MAAIEWHTDALSISFVTDNNGVICLQEMRPHDMPTSSNASPFFKSSVIPLTSVKFAGEGNTADKTAKALIGSYASTRLKYQSHKMTTASGSDSLDICSIDEVTESQVTVSFVAFHGVHAIQCKTTITNESNKAELVLTQLSTLSIGCLTQGSKDWFNDYAVKTATNGWFREAQWREHTLPEVGIDEDGILPLNEGHTGSQAVFGLSNHGSFSTGSHLPMGLLKRKDDADTWLWQVEHNGSWRWEIGDFKDSVYLAAGGPTKKDHDWKLRLKPGESFTTVPVSVCRVNGGEALAFKAMTEHRRRMRRPHVDNEKMPVIFNDYMNCLMGDPTEQKIEDLLDSVAQSGAEYFVIDAGWYADDSDWWDDVGLWEPSQKRFPSGFRQLLDKIRAKGLIPGLWVEPEVVGVRSVVAKRLPDDAFFQECGKRVLERGRYQLDYRHPEVRSWMDKVIDNLVVNYGAGYFKFDYNIEVIQGTDVNAPSSSGAAHLDHQRAYLSWVRSLLDRYPDLVIENCSSGAQRMDYAMLSIHPIQSTSDQQDPVLYAAIAAAVPTAVTPEQSATWAYPQPQWSDEINALTVVNSLLGRIHLSGHLAKLSSAQFDLIAEGMQVYKNVICHDLKQAYPFWPLGLPRWHDDWLCLGMASPQKNVLYLSVWRRGGDQIDVDLSLPLTTLLNATPQSAEIEVLYPRKFRTEYHWDVHTSMLHIELPRTVCARVFRVSITA